MPTPSARPPRVIIFSVYFARYNGMNVAMMEIGIARDMIRVGRQFLRNKNMIRMAIIPP